jgi:hypothetical protein
VGGLTVANAAAGATAVLGAVGTGVKVAKDAGLIGGKEPKADPAAAAAPPSEEPSLLARVGSAGGAAVAGVALLVAFVVWLVSRD